MIDAWLLCPMKSLFPGVSSRRVSALHKDTDTFLVLKQNLTHQEICGLIITSSKSVNFDQNKKIWKTLAIFWWWSSDVQSVTGVCDTLQRAMVTGQGRGGGAQVTNGHYKLFSDNNRQIIHLVPSTDDQSPNCHYSSGPSDNDFITSQQK